MSTFQGYPYLHGRHYGHWDWTIVRLHVPPCTLDSQLRALIAPNGSRDRRDCMFDGHETSSEAQVLVEKLSCFRCSSHLWHIPPPTQLEDFVKSFFFFFSNMCGAYRLRSISAGHFSTRCPPQFLKPSGKATAPSVARGLPFSRFRVVSLVLCKGPLRNHNSL